MESTGNLFFDVGLLDENNVIDLTDKTVVHRLNGNLVMIQVRDDKIVISPVGEGHSLIIKRILDGRTLKITGVKTEGATDATTTNNI